jgi:hypothetical protein
VECLKNLDETQAPYFELPNGWLNQKCRSKNYPDFRTEPCICPGDNGISPEIHKQILDLCYQEEERSNITHASMNVPMKERCGVGSLQNITKASMCKCTERSQKATGDLLTKEERQIRFPRPKYSVPKIAHLFNFALIATQGLQIDLHRACKIMVLSLNC